MTTKTTVAESAFRPTARNFSKFRRMLPRLLTLLLLSAVAIISLFPLYWLFVTALTPASTTVRMPPQIIPKNPTLENIVDMIRISGTGELNVLGTGWIIRMPRMLIWFINTTFIALFSTGFHVFFDAMAGYAFAKRRFPGSRVLFWMILAALMIPGQVTLVPLFLMITKMDLVNSYSGVILPGLADVIGIFLLKQFMQTIPTELEEAARVDGASEWTIFIKIIMPLSVPALAVTAIFAFQRYWNSFLWPLIVLQDPDLFTLQVGLSYIHTSEFGTNYGLLMAGAALAAVPMIIFFFAFQKYFMQGLRIGAIKG
ncbi:MAG: carbohydrate ABC transporter permease [Chloroflexi bacterium]|nr:MAG: carbohydrate ABC transporter permease [Chloroflexota bacterium]